MTVQLLANGEFLGTDRAFLFGARMCRHVSVQPSGGGEFPGTDAAFPGLRRRRMTVSDVLEVIVVEFVFSRVFYHKIVLFWQSGWFRGVSSVFMIVAMIIQKFRLT